MNLESLKYPIGKWTKPSEYQEGQIKTWIDDIRNFPVQFSEILKNLSESELTKRYRPEGWTLRQLAHHVVDSHMNAYIRHKLACSTHEPTINPYPEAIWADMADVRTVPVKHSLQLLHDLHLRWTVFLDSLDDSALERSFYHPQNERFITMKESIGMYSWHSRHHLAHARSAILNPY
jgi:hypothetical protein